MRGLHILRRTDISYSIAGLTSKKGKEISLTACIGSSDLNDPDRYSEVRVRQNLVTWGGGRGRGNQLGEDGRNCVIGRPHAEAHKARGNRTRIEKKNKSGKKN